jgi:hypothetical protein
MGAQVRVKILDDKGKALEQDEAVQVDASKTSGWWEFATTTKGMIVAEAWDLAVNGVESVLE